jgi:hypothetical protein
MRSTVRSFAWPLLLAPLAAACGPTNVQLYEGDKLSADQVTVLWSNPHLDTTVDRQYTIPPAENAKLHRIELPPGNHAVEVRFHYPECGIKDAPPIALLLDGEAGHAYKPRIQIGQNAAGAPSCKARMFDVTSDGAGNKKDYY